MKLFTLLLQRAAAVVLLMRTKLEQLDAFSHTHISDFSVT